MAATRQDQAVLAANNLIGIMSQLKGLRASINDFVTQYNKEAYGTTWNAMGTKAQNADGSLGASDASPVITNPINSAALSSQLNKCVTATMLVNAVAALQQLQNYLNNAAVTTGDRNQIIDDLAS